MKREIADSIDGMNFVPLLILVWLRLVFLIINSDNNIRLDF